MSFDVIEKVTVLECTLVRTRIPVWVSPVWDRVLGHAFSASARIISHASAAGAAHPHHVQVYINVYKTPQESPPKDWQLRKHFQRAAFAPSDHNTALTHVIARPFTHAKSVVQGRARP